MAHDLKLTVQITCTGGRVLNDTFNIEDINDVEWRGDETIGEIFWQDEFENDIERFYQRVEDLCMRTIDFHGQETGEWLGYESHKWGIEDNLPDLDASIQAIIGYKRRLQIYNLIIQILNRLVIQILNRRNVITTEET